MTNTSQTDITITGLIPDKYYLFRVVAVNEFGVGESSPRLKVMTKAEINLPGPPLNLTVKAISSSALSVSWSRPEHGSEFLKEYKLFYMKVFLNYFNSYTCKYFKYLCFNNFLF